MPNSPDAGVGEEDVDPALFALDLVEQAIEVVQIRNIALHSCDIATDLLDGRIESGLPTAGDVDEGAFRYEALCGRETDAAVAARNHCDLSGELSHGDLVLFLLNISTYIEKMRSGKGGIQNRLLFTAGRKRHSGLMPGATKPCPDDAWRFGRLC